MQEYKYCKFIQCLMEGKVIEKTEAGNHLPDNGRVLFTCKNGKITAVRTIYADEHIASLKSLIEMAEMAGCTIVKKDKTTL